MQKIIDKIYRKKAEWNLLYDINIYFSFIRIKIFAIKKKNKKII